MITHCRPELRRGNRLRKLPAGERTVGHAYLTLKDAVSDAGLALPQALLEVQPSALAPLLKSGYFTSGRTKEPAPGSSARNADGAAQPPESEPSKQDGNKFSISLKIPSLFWKILAVVVVVGGSGTFAVLVFKRRRAQEEAALLSGAGAEPSG